MINDDHLWYTVWALRAGGMATLTSEKNKINDDALIFQSTLEELVDSQNCSFHYSNDIKYKSVQSPNSFF